MGRRPTVYDVAARAGVSTATVSFAFTQPDRVKKSTRELVLATAAAIGYVPSASAGHDASTMAAVRGYLNDLPEVFVCSTDQEALVAIDTLVAAGIDVPGQVAVTGFDGTLAGRFATPRLTTVRQPMEDIGRTAVQILLGLLNNSPADPAEPLPAPFVLGTSCGCR
jgi:DNA-binding LacI/PurR family transcriptional regulator